MAKKPEERLRFQLAGVDGVNEDGSSRQDILRTYFKKDEAPFITYTYVDGAPGEGPRMAIKADKQIVGFVPEEDRELVRINWPNIIKAYMTVSETDDDSDEYVANACLVLPKIMTPADVKKSFRGRLLVALITNLALLAMIVFEVMNHFGKGEIIFTAVLFVFSLVLTYVNRPPKDPFY